MASSQGELSRRYSERAHIRLERCGIRRYIVRGPILWSWWHVIPPTHHVSLCLECDREQEQLSRLLRVQLAPSLEPSRFHSHKHVPWMSHMSYFPHATPPPKFRHASSSKSSHSFLPREASTIKLVETRTGVYSRSLAHLPTPTT